MCRGGATGLDARKRKDVSYILLTHKVIHNKLIAFQHREFILRKNINIFQIQRVEPHYLKSCLSFCVHVSVSVFGVYPHHDVCALQEATDRGWFIPPSVCVLAVSLGSKCLYLQSHLTVPIRKQQQQQKHFSDLSSVGLAERQLNFPRCFCILSVFRVCLLQMEALHRRRGESSVELVDNCECCF